jgi:hypothetical protein
MVMFSQGKIMFNLLATQAKLQAVFNDCSNTELENIRNNLKLTVAQLNVDAKELQSNRKTFGKVIPKAKSEITTLNSDELAKLTNKQLLLNQDHLIDAVNTLCLTEVIVVRHNFINCLELIDDEDVPAPIMTKLAATKPLKPASSEKNNVAPIHLSQIKQKLASALISQEEKRQQVKNKLNALSSSKVTPLKQDKVEGL